MTPKEFKLIDRLFDRLATLEGAPHDTDAVRAIEEGLERAPNALYPLVQTVLVQEEALKRAAERIQTLEAERGVAPGAAGEQPGGFLDSMRDTLFGRSAPQGSVPTVRRDPPAGGSHRPMGLPPSLAQGAAGGPQASPGAGGSFLGTAGATAAGVLGGVMVANLFKDLFGGGDQAQTAQAQTAQAQTAQAQTEQAQQAAYDQPGDASGDSPFDLAQHDADDFDDDGGSFWDGDLA